MDQLGAGSGRTRLRTRRRRRRLLRGGIRTLFWGLVLAGVFVLGLGYGKTLSSEDELRTDKVTIDVEPVQVEATLPTETVTRTVTKTVTVRAKARAGRGAGR